MLSSQPWDRYQCGTIDQGTCYRLLEQRFHRPAAEIAAFFLEARKSLRPNNKLTMAIHKLRLVSSGSLKVYAMSDMSKEDCAGLFATVADLGFFDRIFTSGHVGKDKSDTGFYRHVLRKVNLDPKEVVFVDSKTDNVKVARSIGMGCIKFDGTSTTISALRSICLSPVQKGWWYLDDNAKRFDSVIENGPGVLENLSCLLILDATKDLCVGQAWMPP